MLENIRIIWSVDWGSQSRKNWAEKERLKYKKSNEDDYDLFERKLAWFQGRRFQDLFDRRDLERIGSNSKGCKLNFKVRGNTVRVFGYLNLATSTFHALLFLVKKTTRVQPTDLNTFENRIKIYEK